MLWTTRIPDFEHVRQIQAVEILMDTGGPCAYIARDRQQQDWLFLLTHRETRSDHHDETWLAVPITLAQRHDLLNLANVSYHDICEDSPGPFRVLAVYHRRGRLSELSSDARVDRHQIPDHWWPNDHAQVTLCPRVARP